MIGSEGFERESCAQEAGRAKQETGTREITRKVMFSDPLFDDPVNQADDGEDHQQCW